MSNQELTGTVVRGVGGFYYVHARGQVYECRARGRFRLDEISPLVGDQVVIAPEEGKTTGFVTEILPRKNLLTRPPCANVDRFVLVLSAHLPKADLLLADKLLLQAALQKVEPMICLNKCDLASPDEIGALAKDFRALGAPVLALSAKTGQGMSELAGQLAGKISCFAGQSAVGKSSLLNALAPHLALETGGLSKKTARGRHTTRFSSLLPLCGGYAMDTPGFSLLDLAPMPPSELAQYYPEMAPYLGRCRFEDCLHDAEPDCAVKEAVRNGAFPAGRYERYKELLHELKDLYRRRFD